MGYVGEDEVGGGKVCGGGEDGGGVEECGEGVGGSWAGNATRRRGVWGSVGGGCGGGGGGASEGRAERGGGAAGCAPRCARRAERERDLLLLVPEVLSPNDFTDIDVVPAKCRWMHVAAQAGGAGWCGNAARAQLGPGQRETWSSRRTELPGAVVVRGCVGRPGGWGRPNRVGGVTVDTPVQRCDSRTYTPSTYEPLESFADVSPVAVPVDGIGPCPPLRR